MYQVEIWIDVVCQGNGRYETMCVLFADLEVPMRPLINETLSFHQAKGSNLEYKLFLRRDAIRASSVRVTVEEVSHYASGTDDGKISFKTALRCSEISVESDEDARTVCKLMTEQHGFEIDPYGVNKLEA